jgi:FkbM family methyltransferase
MAKQYQVPSNALYYDDEAEIRDAHWHPKDGDRVIDVGARYGSYTLPALAVGAHVTAVDYNAEMLQILRGAAALNGFEALETMCVMLFDDTEYPIELSRQIDEPCPPQGVGWATLDDIAPGRVDWIKIDVEGAELAVLNGGVRTLREHHPALLIEDHTRVYEWVRENLIADQMHNLLRSMGYSITSVPYSAATGSPRDFTIAT